MQKPRVAKRISAIALSASIVLSFGMIGQTQAFAAGSNENNKISYSFASGQKAGYAEGTISFTADSAGTYKLYWADDQKALEGYYPIEELKMSAGQTKTVKMGYHTVIPHDATKIIATTGSLNTANAYSVYSIPAAKKLSGKSGNLLYTFSTYSDIHIDKRDGTVYWKRAENNWRSALSLSADKGADYIVISGDCITGKKPDKEWQAYEKIISESDYVNPVWESDGNHDLKNGPTEGHTKFINASGTDGSKNSKSYYSMVEQNSKDLFIFMSLELGEPNEADVFTDDQIEWARELISDNYTTKNIFLVEHSPVRGFGAGDRMSDPYYGGLMDPSKKNNGKFKQLLKDFPNIVFLSGHTHEDFSMDYNYFDNCGDSAVDNDGKAASMIHTPALAGSTLPKDSSSLDYFDGDHDSCQGYFVEVYENEIVFNGVNVTDEGYIFPKYSYIMEGARTSRSETGTTPSEIELTGIEVDAAETLSSVSKILSKYYTYASYDRYQALKKLYYKYKDAQTLDQAVVDAFADKVNSLSIHTGPISFGTTTGDTYYFTNNKKWSSVYAYAWSETSEGTVKNAKWPGVQLTRYGVNDQNQDIYRVQFDSPGQYENLIFNSGSNSAQTEDIALADYPLNGFYISGSSTPFSVGNYDGNAIEGNHYSLLYYLEDGSHQWTDTSTYLTPNGDGTFRINYKATGTGAFSFCIYDRFEDSYNCISSTAGVSSNFAAGGTENYTFTSLSSRGKSVTIYGLQEDSYVNLTYNPAQNKVSIIYTQGSEVSELQNNSILSASTVSCGEKAVITGAASGGTGVYTYAYSLKKSDESVWNSISDGYVSDTTMYFSTATPGDYQIKVSVKDSSGRVKDKLLALKVENVPLQNNSQVSSKNITKGSAIRLKGYAAGGTGPYTFSYIYKLSTKNSWNKLSDGYVPDTVMTLRLGKVGDFNVRIIVKDAAGQVLRKSFLIKVSEPADFANTSTVSATSVKKGGQIQINASAAGGTAPYTHAYYYKLSSKSTWNKLTDGYVSATSKTLRLGKTGQYDVKVMTKDAAGNVAEKQFRVTVS